MSEQNCGNCDAFLINSDLKVKPGLPHQGWCRRNPPSVVIGMQQQMTVQGPQMLPVTQGQFPPTATNIWCGQWKPLWARNAKVIEHDRAASQAPAPQGGNNDATDPRPAA